MDLLDKIDMVLCEDYNRPDTRYGKPSKESEIEKKVKQHNISVKYGKKGALTRPPEGYVKDNKGMYHKVDDKEWKKSQLKEATAGEYVIYDKSTDSNLFYGFDTRAEATSKLDSITPAELKKYKVRFKNLAVKLGQ